VGDHHVAVGAGLLVEAGALAEAQGLRHVDLHVVDEIAVPDGLEQPVGEAEGENVLRRFLAEKMIDAKDPVLVEHFVQPRIQRHRTREVGAEGLLHDDPRAIDQAGLAEQAHRGQRGVRRHAQVVQPTALAFEASRPPRPPP
jgi:hypothetical protein